MASWLSSLLSGNQDDVSVRDLSLDGADEISEAELLHAMPSLFSKDLPPCNAVVQVAYENVINELCKRWLNRRGKERVAETCRYVKTNLANQSLLWPVTALPRERTQRKPWRCELVFQYELRWIDYFTREAETSEPITESKIIKWASQSPVPEDLGLECDRADVLQMWDAWLQKKRANPPSAHNGEQLNWQAGVVLGVADEKATSESPGI